ncbi:Nramp family divalent metal transporter [Brevibacterium sp. UCMA 11754]|uniref:Nramp family divalent metal transporter n=1 Tax=Brevibacterium sp. UCMA 11754 TaxID=2749198 RepID=UPI001F3D0D47|nr:Nramp family divalent metal transporter [Brevibacterium sp. UCMA 11754]MCF2573507.1 Nramp family divalent metal transporter [Brevibacterium sp. UCMA 11754]
MNVDPSITGSPGVTAARPKKVSIFFLLGPAFVAAIAYVDPGNVAANLSAGAQYGYLLVWVLVAANLIAVLVQYLSSKLGLVSGQSLPSLLGNRLSRRSRLAYWGQAEIVAIATDIAEVIGGAIALKILFDLPLLLGGIIVGVVSLFLLSIQSTRGQRPFETVIMTLLAIIAIGFLAGLFVGDVNWGQAAGGIVPRLEGTNSVVLAASMLGATVMPHAIYLHSALSVDRHGAAPRASIPQLLRASRWDVVLSLVIAGSVNIAMLLLAAASLRGQDGTDTIEGAHAVVSANLGEVVGLFFGIGLLASGLASSAVGSYAGASIMQGLLRINVPIVWQRAVTMIPALVILGIGADPTWSLVLSQVVLSLGIPFAMIPLVRLTMNRAVMGQYANSRIITIVAVFASGLIIALNVVLIVLLAFGVD